MADEQSTTATPIPAFAGEEGKEVRRLLHDLNNALEVIVQANYLVSTAALPEEVKPWVKLLDQGVQQAAVLSRELREHIRKHS